MGVFDPLLLFPNFCTQLSMLIKWAFTYCSFPLSQTPFSLHTPTHPHTHTQPLHTIDISSSLHPTAVHEQAVMMRMPMMSTPLPATRRRSSLLLLLLLLVGHVAGLQGSSEGDGSSALTLTTVNSTRFPKAVCSDSSVYKFYQGGNVSSDAIVLFLAPGNGRVGVFGVVCTCDTYTNVLLSSFLPFLSEDFFPFLKTFFLSFPLSLFFFFLSLF